MPRWSIPRVTGDDLPTLRDDINRSIEDNNLVLAELEQLEQQLKGQGGYVAELSSNLRMNGHAITGLPAHPANDSAATSLAFLKSGRLLYSESDSFITDKTIVGVAAVSPNGLATLAQIQQLLAETLQSLDATAAPPKVDDASAIGVLNRHFAREQHTHQGVNLDVAQTITGRKTYATDLVCPLLIGSIASGGNLTLKSTEHATKGNILFGTSVYDEVNNRLGLGTTTPLARLHATISDSGTGLSNGVLAEWENTDTTVNNRSTLALMTLDSGASRIDSSRISGVHVSHTAGAVSGALTFQTRNAGTMAERMRITEAGSVGIGVTAPATSALLELSSTTGALLGTRLTTTERDALTAVNGMIIYNSTAAKFQGYEAGVWVNLI